ncbi:MAG: acetolactate synthase small subunit [Vulcanibacillus sp.]
MERHVLSILVENQAGVLSRVAGLFTRRGYNIDSLTVGETTDSKISRMTIVVRGDEYILEQIRKQLNKLIDVIEIVQLMPENSVYRELAIIKVKADTTNRAEIFETVNIFRGKIIDIASGSVIVEATGDEKKISALVEILTPYGIKELVRTGLTALERGNKDINKKNKYTEVN